MKPALLILVISALLAILPPFLAVVIAGWLMASFEWRRAA